MDIDILTVSFPLDAETAREIQELLLASKMNEGSIYEHVVNIPVMTDPLTKGFAVLAYGGEAVVGIMSAVDVIGVHSYEWFGLVHPDFRRQGLGEAMIGELQRNLKVRGAESELALNIKESEEGRSFLQQAGYVWNFSEATLKAMGNGMNDNREVVVVPLTIEREELTKLLMNAFGDTEDEVHTLLDFNSINPARQVYIAKRQGEIVGTVTAVESGKKLWVTALATDPAYQGQGIATALLAFVQAEGERRASESVMLEVEIDNDKALSVYEKAGFKPILQVDYYVKSVSLEKNKNQ